MTKPESEAEAVQLVPSKIANAIPARIISKSEIVAASLIDRAGRRVKALGPNDGKANAKAFTLRQ
jgi:hypothetical protein